MSLDILTEKGQQTVLQEQRAKQILEMTTKFVYVETPKDKPCAVDAVLVSDGCVVGVAETKCRNMSILQLQRFNNEGLVTEEKLLNARNLAKALYVPLYGVLYLVPDDTVLFKKLSKVDGSWDVPFRTEETKTQATVNGGIAVRSNAFIDMSKAELLMEVL
jgi:hypothetical protein